MKKQNIRLPRNTQKLDARIELAEKQLKVLGLEHQLKKVKANFNRGGFGSGYSGAGTRERWSKNWDIMHGTADQLVLYDRWVLADRAADLYRNNAIAKAAIDTTCLSVVGKGINPQSNINTMILNMSEDQADAWQEKTEYLFSKWASSINCDAYRKQNFYQLQYLAFKTFLMRGEALALLPRRDRDGVNRITVQLLDPNRLGYPGQTVSDNYRDGVKLNDLGEVESYFISKKESFFSNILNVEEIPAFGANTGRRNVLHIFEPDFVGQSRGVSVLSTVIEQLKNSDRATKNELINQAVSTMFTGFIKSNRANALNNPFSFAGATSTEDEDEEDPNYTLDAGAIFRLRENEELQFANPQRGLSAFKDFMLWNCQLIGMAIGVPYGILVKKVDTNFSAHKADRIEAWRYFLRMRALFNQQYNTPIYLEWLIDEVLAGRIEAPGFLENQEWRMAYSGVEWEGEGMGQIDPTKETQAAQMRIDGNLSTYEKETSLIGGDFETNIKRKAREVRKLKKLGLTISQNPVLPGMETDQSEDDEEIKNREGEGNEHEPL